MVVDFMVIEVPNALLVQVEPLQLLVIRLCAQRFLTAVALSFTVCVTEVLAITAFMKPTKSLVYPEKLERFPASVLNTEPAVPELIAAFAKSFIAVPSCAAKERFAVEKVTSEVVAYHALYLSKIAFTATAQSPAGFDLSVESHVQSQPSPGSVCSLAAMYFAKLRY